MADSWLVPGALAWAYEGMTTQAPCVLVAYDYGGWWVIRYDDGRTFSIDSIYLSPRAAEPAPEPVWPDGERARDAALDLCVLCGVPLANESDVEAGYVTAFARDPADVTRCLSHGRTSLGGGR